MAEQSARSRSLLKPVVGGLVVIVVLVGVIFFRSQLFDAVKWIGRTFGDWITNWVPDHPGASGAIVGFLVVSFIIDWFAHVRGRLRALIFAMVVEVGLWLLFWYGLGIPSFNELFGLNIPRISANEVVLSGAVVIVVTALIFWYLEAREEWQKYRHQHDPD